MKKLLILMILLTSNLFALNTVDNQTRSFTEERKIEILLKWAPSADHIIVANALIAHSSDKYKYMFNILANNNFMVTSGLYERIDSEGGKFIKFPRRCRIVEVDKNNPKVVRIEYQMEYSNDISDSYYTHVGSLETLEKYKQRFL